MIRLRIEWQGGGAELWLRDGIVIEVGRHLDKHLRFMLGWSQSRVMQHAEKARWEVWNLDDDENKGGV